MCLFIRLRIDNLRRAVRENPQDMDARADFAEFFAKNGENDAAIEQLLEIMKVQPKNPAVLEALFKVHAQKGDWAAAHATAKRIKAEFPNNGLGAHLAGLAYQGEKKFDLSTQEFERAFEQSLGTVEPLSQMVKNYLAQNRADTAYERLAKALEHDPKNVAVYIDP